MLLEALHRLQSHVENSPLAVIEFAPDYQVIRWSGEAQRIFGWSAEEVLENRIADLPWVYEEDIIKVATLSADMLAGRSLRNSHVNRNYRKDGSVIECEW